MVTNLTFDTERYDTDNFHSTVSNTDRLTVPKAGKYLLYAGFRFAVNGTGYRQIFIRLNGATGIAINSWDGSTLIQDMTVVAIWDASAGDYFTASLGD